jgi:hypothetical protein
MRFAPVTPGCNGSVGWRWTGAPVRARWFRTGRTRLRIEIGEVREQLKAREAELRDAAVDLRHRPLRVGYPKAAESHELVRIRPHYLGELVVDPPRPLICFRAEDVGAEGKTMAEHRDIDAEAIHCL